MNRSILLAVLVVLVFVVILIARLPAAWVLSGPRSDLHCVDTAGTIWNGSCSGMTARGQPIGDLSWEVHAGRLLAGKFAASVLLTRGTGSARGTVELGFGGQLNGRDIHIDLPLDPKLIQQLPPNLTGNVHADLASLQMKQHAITSMQGQVEARDLQLGTGANAEPFGSYELTFNPTSGPPVGELRDLGGPLEVTGSLKLTSSGFDLQGLVKPRAGAPEALVRELQILGSPDAQGRRPFGFEENF